MSENTCAALLFSIVGVVYIGLGIPLLLQRVPPNGFYGCRTMKTLSDVNTWYAVNRVTGRDLIIGGVAILFAALAVYLFGQAIDSKYVAAILLAVLISAVLMMVVNSLRAQRRM